MARRRVAVAGASYANDDAVVVDLESAPDEVSGADIVVIAAELSDEFAPAVRDRAPNAVVVVIGGSPHKICETTLFPRARIIGVDDESQAARVADAIVYDRETEFESVVRCEGEHGMKGEFARVPIRVAGGGVVEIIER